MELAWVVLLASFACGALRNSSVRYGHQNKALPQFTPPARRLSCYSCASTAMMGLPDPSSPNSRRSFLHGIAEDPLLFTSACDEETFDANVVPRRTCQVACITIHFHTYILATYVPMYYRGCSASLNTFNAEMLRRIYRRNCLAMDMSKLFTDTKPDRTKMSICACVGDNCNGKSQTWKRDTFWTLVLLLLLVSLFGP